MWARAVLACAFTLWVLGCANAMNMLDGLDGLAAGVSAIAAVGVGIVALRADNVACTMVSFALTGACVGFLRYNFRPASTFMGDVGSLFLGFALASSVLLLSKGVPGQPVLPSVLGAMVALGVPVGDMLLAMGRRLVNHRPMFQGDRSHFYDQLRDRFGFGVVKTVVTLYAVAAAFCVLGFGISLLVWPQALTATAVIVSVAVAAVLRGGFLRREGDAT
jgi:UDP-GlcNAc:undecaprenyl-phosphate GlcNAc-1-phosphate transferase